MRFFRVLVAAVLSTFSGLGLVVASATAAHAAGPDLAISVTQADSPTSQVATRVTIAVTNAGDATSGTATVSATVTGSGHSYQLAGHPGWTCGLPLADTCTHPAIAAGGSASPLSVDLILTNGPVTFTVTVASAGDSSAANNTATFTVQPRAMVVTGTVWSDDNGNGRKDAGEPGLSDVKLQALVAGTNTVIATEWTFGDTYKFILPNAAPNITIVVDPANEQSRYLTTANVGPGDDLDSDFPADGKLTIPFAVGTIVDLDAGLLPKGVSPSPSSSPQAGGNLPTTGVSLPLLLAAGGLLILFGAMLLMLRAKRSNA